MHITIRPLNKDYFSYLLTWLNTSHVKRWWDPLEKHTKESIEKKYQDRIHRGITKYFSTKKVYGFIAAYEYEPIGYVQIYNFHAWNKKITDIPPLTAGLDFFIGNPLFLSKGLGTLILTLTLDIIAPYFEYCIVNPSLENQRAINTFTKADFEIYTKNPYLLIKKL